MTILSEVIQKGLEWFNKWKYSIPRLPYTDADYTRNLWIISMKKAIRWVIKAHEPYANRYRLTELSALLSKAIMQLYNCPQLKDYYDDLCTEIFNKIKYVVVAGWGQIRWGVDPYG